MLAGRSAPVEVEELIAQLRRLTPSLVVAKIGVGEETDGAHYFPPLEGMDLFPVIVAHLLQSIPKSVPPAGRTPSTAGGVAARSVASPGSGPYRVALAADVPARA
jgi:hypothetical protein